MFEIRTYAVVEQALAAAYDVAPKDVPALRSRLGALQRGGLFAARPGKGRKLGYGPDEFHRLVFALELTAWGIAPSLILELLDEFWEPKLNAIFRQAEGAIMHPTDDGDIALVIIGGDQMFRATRDSLFPRLSFASMRDLPQLMNVAMKDKPLPARAIVVNLSARLRRFHNALADAHDLREPVLHDLHKPVKRAKKRSMR